MDPEGFIEDEANCLVALLIENDTWLISTTLSYKAAKVWERPTILRAF